VRFLPFTRRAKPEDRFTVVEHLSELRSRIVISVLALIVAFAVTYTFHGTLIDILEAPLPADQKDQLKTFSPTEPFFTILKVSFWAAVIASVPVWSYQLYAFVIPAVANQSRKIMLIVVAGVSSLFLAGVAFGYFIVLPVALNFLLDFGAGTFDTQLRAGEYFSFATTLLLGAGLIFEVPVAMLALARMGVVTAEMYRKQWRVAIVAIAAIAAILPGGDPFSMFLLMIPQLILYQVGIWLAAAFGGPPLWTRERWAGDQEPEPEGSSST
jgi:sec-independent protein translocase protein TatC